MNNHLSFHEKGIGKRYWSPKYQKWAYPSPVGREARRVNWYIPLHRVSSTRWFKIGSIFHSDLFTFAQPHALTVENLCLVLCTTVFLWYIIKVKIIQDTDIAGCSYFVWTLYRHVQNFDLRLFKFVRLNEKWYVIISTYFLMKLIKCF